MDKKRITLTFNLGQVCDDVLAKCNLISKGIRDEAMADIKADIQEPDGPETRSIICRAVTESFGEVKKLAMRYMTTGRTTDNNNLERLVQSVTYKKGTVDVQDEDSAGNLLYVGQVSGVSTDVYADGDDWKRSHDAASGADETVTIDEGTTPTMKTHQEEQETEEIDTITYETITLVMDIPNFNVAVTDHLKSMIHKYVVDWVMFRFLQDQVSDKAAEYKGLADGDDRTEIVTDLNARDNFTMRKPSWV